MSVIGQTHHKKLVGIYRILQGGRSTVTGIWICEQWHLGQLSFWGFQAKLVAWFERIQIALGIARGLLYLHEECNAEVIHCDINPQNILLDEHHDGRVSNFRLVELLESNQTQTFTVIIGTKGHVALKWCRNKPITPKVHVYSFGVLLLEKLYAWGSLGRKEQFWQIGHLIATNLEPWTLWLMMTLRHLMTDYDWRRLIMVALWRIQEDPTLRPMMRTVTQMLEGLAEVPNPPCHNSFSIMVPTSL